MNAEQWLNYLLPCPKELSIDDSIEIEIKEIFVPLTYQFHQDIVNQFYMQ